MLTSATWIALQTRPKRERMVSQGLRSKGVEDFLPLIRKHYVESRRGTREVPLFPGYVFCRYDSRAAGQIVSTPGVVRIVGFGREPLPVEEMELRAVMAVVSAGYTAEPCDFLQQGDQVQITDGPLSGLQGMLIASRRRWRIVISIRAVQRSMAVDVDRRLVRRLRTDAPRKEVEKGEPSVG